MRVSGPVDNLEAPLEARADKVMHQRSKLVMIMHGYIYFYISYVEAKDLLFLHSHSCMTHDALCLHVSLYFYAVRFDACQMCI